MSQGLIAPGPSGHWLLGSLPALNRDALALFSRTQSEYGDIVRLRLAHKVAHVLSHPAMAEQALIGDTDRIVKYTQVKAQLGLSLIVGKGLLSSYGELWRRQRDLLNPAFRPASVNACADSLISCGRRLIERLEARASAAGTVDIWQESVHTAMEAALASLFGANEPDAARDTRDAMTLLLRHAFASIRNPLTPPLAWPTRRNRQFRAALRSVDAQVQRLVREREAAPARRQDLLDLLLFGTPANGERLPPSQIRDEAVTMLAAGHETTAASLTWALLQIAREPRIAARLRDELAQVVGAAPLSVAHLPRLSYLQAVVQETLRLYGPAAVISRAALRETRIAGYRIPAGSMIFVCVHNIHRHAQFWDRPHEFLPERFLGKRDAGHRHRCAYIPFGAGERFCIGRNFAALELQVFLAQLIDAFAFEAVERRPIQSEFAITLRPAEPVWLRVSRNSARAPSFRAPA